jgi:3-oxoacyl-ACP reductase-like protein
MKIPKSPYVTVSITAEAITSGIERDSKHCVIAEGVKTSYPTATSISVDLQSIRFSDRARGLRFTYLTPRVAQAYIVNLDQGRREKLQPFDFQLRAGQVTRCGGARKGDAKRPLTEAQRTQLEALNKARLTSATARRGVGDRVGGKTPPLQTTHADGVPFTRRRRFGLRALEF